MSNKRCIIQHIKLSVRANFGDIYLQGMLDRSMWSGTQLAWEIQLTDWSTAGNLSNRSSGVQIPLDLSSRFGHYLYSVKCSWIMSTWVIDQVWGQDGQILAKFFFTVFMDEAISSHLDRTSLVNKGFVWLLGKFCLRNTAGSPKRAR